MAIHVNWQRSARRRDRATPKGFALARALWRSGVGYWLAITLLGLPATHAAETQPSTQNARAPVDLAELMADPADMKTPTQRLEALQAIVDAAQTPLDRANAQLALANWILAVPTARPATRWLMGLPTSADSAKLAEAAQTAEVNLEGARDLLKAEAPEAKERRRTLKSAATTLEAFAKMFAAIGTAPKGTCTPCGEAALGLATAREAEDPEIASAALLWQSLGWELASRRERALTSLPNALEKPENLPYDFMSRLLRCRLLAESGQKTAAVALTLRIGELCEKWFPRLEGQGLQEKRRLVALLQYKFIREWIDRLNLGDQTTTQKLETLLGETQKSLVTEEGRLPLYYLEASIPILVEPPKLPPRSSIAPAASRPAASENDGAEPASQTSTNPVSE